MSVHSTHGSVLCSEDTQRYSAISLPDATHSIPQTAARPSAMGNLGQLGFRSFAARQRGASRSRRAPIWSDGAAIGAGLVFLLTPIGTRVHAVAADLHRTPHPGVVL